MNCLRNGCSALRPCIAPATKFVSGGQLPHNPRPRQPHSTTASAPTGDHVRRAVTLDSSRDIANQSILPLRRCTSIAPMFRFSQPQRQLQILSPGEARRREVNAELHRRESHRQLVRRLTDPVETSRVQSEEETRRSEWETVHGRL